MKNYRKTSHSVYDLKYHLVWMTSPSKPDPYVKLEMWIKWRQGDEQ
jgi:hypothetical protein